MRIAAVHCRLFPGGALEVFKDLLQQELRNDPKSEIEIFTMIADEKLKQLEIQIPGTNKFAKINVTESLPKWLSQVFTYFSKNKIRVLSSLFDYRNLIVFYPEVMKNLSKKIKKFGPERIVISSYAIAKNIDIPDSCKYTKLYLHSPMQYIWSHREEYIGKFKGWKKYLFKHLIPRLQNWDIRYTKFDEVIFNSKYTQGLAEKIYGIKGKVRYPKLKDDFYYSSPSNEIQNYYVCVGRVVNFVREVGLIIKTCNVTKTNLIIIGSGPDELELKSIAGDTVIFVGRLPANESIKIIKNAKGLINLTKESFGMGTAEALLLGVPVIGFSQGGSAELVDKGSGILIKEKNIKTLTKALKDFEGNIWNRRKISDNIRDKLNKYK